MKKVTRFVLLFVAMLAGSVSAQQYEVGKSVAVFEAKDQHGKDYKLDANTRFILLSDDMSTGKKANGKLDEKGAQYLPQHKAVYVANINGMPGVGRFFAFKKMKKYSHRIIYADTENFMTPFPVKKDMITVLKLSAKGKILKIAYWNPATEAVEEYLK